MNNAANTQPATEFQVVQRERMLRELMSDLADMVGNGDLTSEAANEWYSDKADQWNA